MTPHASTLPRRRLLALGTLALLGGCSLGRGPRMDFHLLRDAGAQSGPPAGPAVDKVLLLSAGAMPGLYDSDRMVFSADGRSRSYFQFGYWSERPAQSLQVLAETRLVRSQRFRQVASSTSGVRGDLLLSLRLDELYLDAAEEQGLVKLVVSAELIDWRNRQLLSRRSFVQSAAVPQRDADGLAAAASQAVGAMLGELVAWAGDSAAG
jgi:ABC-type uncharacterized transport system auxiliary subunit